MVVNVKDVWVCTKYAIKQMETQGQRVIVETLGVRLSKSSTQYIGASCRICDASFPIHSPEAEEDDSSLAVAKPLRQMVMS
jgi:hypothetical protein